MRAAKYLIRRYSTRRQHYFAPVLYNNRFRLLLFPLGGEKCANVLHQPSKNVLLPFQISSLYPKLFYVTAREIICRTFYFLVNTQKLLISVIYVLSWNVPHSYSPWIPFFLYLAFIFFLFSIHIREYKFTVKKKKILIKIETRNFIFFHCQAPSKFREQKLSSTLISPSSRKTIMETSSDCYLFR